MTGTFKDRLLVELRAEAATVAWEPVRTRRPGRHLLTGAGLAGAAVAVAVVVPLFSDAPAFAVDKNPDGTVTVRIHEFVKPKELERSLLEAGVPARGPVAPCVPVAADDSDKAPGGGGSVEPPSSPGVP